MSKLWVKFGKNNSTQVATEGCSNVDDFIKQCKKELQIPNPPQELSLSTTDGGIPLRPGLLISDILSQPGYSQNDDEKPLFISVTVAGKAKNEMVSMSYGTATMSFISEATGIEDEIQVWENIPIDVNIEASQEFVELFKKNCSVF